jgi:hypothetical protein
MILFLLSFIINAQEPIRIAVIDSGISPEASAKINHCDKKLNKSFTDDTLYDFIGHGTNITGLIYKNVGFVKHCFIIIKVWGDKGRADNDPFTKGLQYATLLHPDIINLSGGGYGKNLKEQNIVLNYLNKGGILVNAAGNDGKYLEKETCSWYPGCYDARIMVIGNKGNNSNYGPRINMIIDGNNKEGFGEMSSGSSQSAAIFTGMAVKLWKIKKNSSK